MWTIRIRLSPSTRISRSALSYAITAPCLKTLGRVPNPVLRKTTINFLATQELGKEDYKLIVAVKALLRANVQNDAGIIK
jgi:hypothetical protein